MRQQLGPAPAVAADGVTKSYVDFQDALSPFAQAVIPPVGWIIGPTVLSTSTAAAVTGSWNFAPIWIGYGGVATFDAILLNVTTAAAAGTATAVTVAVFADNGSGIPKTDTVLATGSIALASLQSTGEKVATLSPAVTLPSGLYWLGVLYYQGTTAPTTAPVFTSLSSNTYTLATPTTVGYGTPIRNYKTVATTYTTAIPGVLMTTANMTVNTSANMPYPSLRRSA